MAEHRVVEDQRLGRTGGQQFAADAPATVSLADDQIFQPEGDEQFRAVRTGGDDALALSISKITGWRVGRCYLFTLATAGADLALLFNLEALLWMV